MPYTFPFHNLILELTITVSRSQWSGHPLLLTGSFSSGIRKTTWQGLLHFLHVITTGYSLTLHHLLFHLPSCSSAPSFCIGCSSGGGGKSTLRGHFAIGNSTYRKYLSTTLYVGIHLISSLISLPLTKPNHHQNI